MYHWNVCIAECESKYVYIQHTWEKVLRFSIDELINSSSALFVCIKAFERGKKVYYRPVYVCLHYAVWANLNHILLISQSINTHKDREVNRNEYLCLAFSSGQSYTLYKVHLISRRANRFLLLCSEGITN